MTSKGVSLERGIRVHLSYLDLEKTHRSRGEERQYGKNGIWESSREASREKETETELVF